MRKMFGLVLAALMTGGAVAQADVVTSTLDITVEPSQTVNNTVLSVRDGAFAGEIVTHTFLRFELPTLAPGEVFVSAQLQLFQTNYWSWTAGNDSSPAAFRVWETDNTWDASTTWATQPTKFQLATWPLTDDGDLLDTQFYDHSDSGDFVTWDVLDAMASGATISLVLDVDRDAVGGSGGGGAWYHSIEQGTAPRIEYTTALVPEPASAGLLVVGGALMFCRWRRY